MFKSKLKLKPSFLDGVLNLNFWIKARNSMKIGDRIRVIESVVVYHHPQNKQKPFDIKGTEGEIIDIIDTSIISATLPIVVKFEPKFNAHLRESEIEVI